MKKLTYLLIAFSIVFGTVANAGLATRLSGLFGSGGGGDTFVTQSSDLVFGGIQGATVPAATTTNPTTFVQVSGTFIPLGLMDANWNQTSSGTEKLKNVILSETSTPPIINSVM